MSKSDPFAGIPDPSARFLDTVFETPFERSQRQGVEALLALSEPDEGRWPTRSELLEASRPVPDMYGGTYDGMDDGDPCLRSPPCRCWSPARTCAGVAPDPEPVTVEFRLMYQRFDYRTMKYVGKPTVMLRSPDRDFIAGRVEVERSASGAPEEWWAEKVTTERLSL